MNRIMNEIISDVKYLKQGIYEEEKLSDVYRSGNISSAYGWHNQRFPPEIRKACLNRKPFQVEASTRLYYLMSGWYERISGCRAPCNFEVYGDWKRRLQAGARERYELTEGETSLLIKAIEAGTRFRKGKRSLTEVLNSLTASDL